MIFLYDKNNNLIAEFEKIEDLLTSYNYDFFNKLQSIKNSLNYQYYVLDNDNRVLSGKWLASLKREFESRNKQMGGLLRWYDSIEESDYIKPYQFRVDPVPYTGRPDHRNSQRGAKTLNEVREMNSLIEYENEYGLKIGKRRTDLLGSKLNWYYDRVKSRYNDKSWKHRRKTRYRSDND